MIEGNSIDSKHSSGQFRIIRSVRADVPMLNHESSYEQLSLHGSHEDLMVDLNPDLDNKYKSTTKN